MLLKESTPFSFSQRKFPTSLSSDPIRLPDHFNRLENLFPYGNIPDADHLALPIGHHAVSKKSEKRREPFY
jgi:hypothetical protein